MNRSFSSLLGLITVSYPASIALPASAQISAVPNAMNFGGRLAKPDGTPVANETYSVLFSLYDALTGGNLKFSQTKTVTSRNGTFATTLDSFPPGTFNGNLWLELKIGADSPLSPRQPLVSVAYALKAGSVSDGSLTNASIAPGTITSDKFAPNALNSLTWLIGGNNGITGGFLGTIDLNPLIFKVNNRRGMQSQYAENTANSFRSINLLGGSEINSLSSGITGATIAGGGLDYFTGTDYPNRVTGDFGTVGGGFGNTATKYATVGGGTSNTTTGDYATVAGGQNNTAGGIDATVSGGSGNSTGAIYATVAGGQSNSATGNSAFIGGGSNNIASGGNAFVAGGSLNAASGQYSFAGGLGAAANHGGAFVWSDSQGTTFASTGTNQFLVRAGGGVGINTNNPAGFAFNVNGTAKIEGNLTVNTTTYTSDARIKRNIVTLENSLDALMHLRGVSYEWDRAKWKERNFAAGRQIGFIAQEVEQIFPELVVTGADGYKSVNYIGVVPVAVEAIKTLEARLDAQQKQLEDQNREITELKKQNSILAELAAKIELLEKKMRR